MNPKKRPFYLFVILITLFVISSNSHAQKTYDAEGTVVSFNSPYDNITLLVDDDETEYAITPSTSIKKGATIEEIKVGQKIDISYYLENDEYVIKKIAVESIDPDKKIKFTGLFEFSDNDLAYVDGKKVKLVENGTIECPGKRLFKKSCGCEQKKPYRGIDDKNIKMGSYFNVEGKLDSNGIIQATKINVCKNEVTKDELEVRYAVEDGFSSKGLVKTKAPKGFNAANGLYKGNIKIGDLEYKLYDDLKVQGYINMVGNKLIPEYAQEDDFLAPNNILWRFYVIQNPIPNAFAYPNGMVFIHTGLLRVIENEAQLALVLGHEIAHVLYEHSAQRYSKNKLLGGELFKSGFNKITSLVPGLKKSKKGDDEIVTSINGLVKQFAPQNLSGLFEKTKETQADRIGLLYMNMVGYDLREAPKFWLKMKSLTGDGSFQQKLNNNVKSIVQSKSLKIDKNILSQLGSEAINAIGGTLLENIYASHPLATKRYDDINYLINTYYKDIDFNRAQVGTGDYRKYLGVIK